MNNSFARKTGIALLVIVALFAFGIRASHPHGGLTNALGSAKSGIAIYKKTQTVDTGAKIVYVSDKKEISPALGSVIGKNPKYYDIENGQFLEGVNPENVQGKLLFVVPFLGYIANLVGL
ncbi:MAG: hypothetical protein RL414_535 [Actinomycetota bacterium]|jgi:hypothetical protein